MEKKLITLEDELFYKVKRTALERKMTANAVIIEALEMYFEKKKHLEFDDIYFAK